MNASTTRAYLLACVSVYSNINTRVSSSNTYVVVHVLHVCTYIYINDDGVHDDDDIDDERMHNFQTGRLGLTRRLRVEYTQRIYT